MKTKTASDYTLEWSPIPKQLYLDFIDQYSDEEKLNLSMAYEFKNALKRAIEGMIAEDGKKMKVATI